jgi:hypothetical protein
MPLTIRAERSEFRLGHLGPLLVVVWYTEPTVAALEVLEATHRELFAAHGKLTLLSVILRAGNSPPPEVRAKIDAQTAPLSAMRLGSVVVVLLKGIAAIFVRTYLAALSLTSPEVMKVVKSVEDAAVEIRRLPGQQDSLRAADTLAGDMAAFLELPAPT